MTKQPRLVFVNVPWMKRYEGASKDDMPRGGFSWTKEHPLDDATQFNFRKYNGRYYGHIPGSTNPTLTRLGAEPGAGAAKNVTVIWFAMDPDSKRRVVVGWYRNATVWRQRQLPKTKQHQQQRKTRDGHICDFSIEASSAPSRLLLPGQRPPLFVGNAPKKGGPGENPFWYGKPAVNARVLAIISQPKKAGVVQTPSGSNKHPGGGWNLDHEEKLKIEKCAMDFTKAYFRGLGYKTKDVSADKEGYDILAHSQTGALYLEVKGKKHGDLNIELTPHEYKFAKANSTTFRVCVVLDALKKPRLIELRHKNGDWRDRQGKTYMGVEKPALVICS